MSFFFKFIIIVTAFSCFMPSLMAQKPELGGVSVIKDEFKFPSLEVVIDSVLKRSAMVRFRKNNIGVTKSALATERIYWSKNLGAQADTRYGNLSNFATSEDGISNTAALTTAKQFNYSVGFYLKIPIFDVLNRKNKIKLARLEVDEAKSMAEFQKEEIKK